MSASKLPISQRDFEHLYMTYKPRFLRIAQSYVRDAMTAEDLVAESFIQFLESRATVDTEHIPAYLLSSVKNRCLNYLRDCKRHHEAHDKLRTSAVRTLEQHLDILETTLPETMRYAEVSEIIERTLRGMPERTRRVFLAHRIENMSYKEIERLYGLSERQINYRLQTAKEQLRVALKDYAPLLALWTVLH
ncbi:DNA-directed RNA polymerase sigma-70 factor [Alistipes communis]|jgi:RNA polymerase sigma-70 factor|uniref:DNA-directed RNA polymerase sigma-70 factor n=1 Tax=Alistipes communis TaxID=2585118 RepID=A0A4Y1WNV6_9BACT|nr:RNA polymerase sigma-70 factor [Alistipes communis]BBL02803.1 DNA-directed RNA polymerase sigma-70 factor [Alistipes communis]